MLIGVPVSRRSRERRLPPVILMFFPLSPFLLFIFVLCVQRVQQAPVTLPPSLPFEGESSYRTEYGPKPLPPPPKTSSVTMPASLPFEATTAYRTDYGPKPLPPPIKPAEIQAQPSLPFEASSSYRYTAAKLHQDRCNMLQIEILLHSNTTQKNTRKSLNCTAEVHVFLYVLNFTLYMYISLGI